MRIFVTGATGFIGARVVPELIASGHQVLGLTRSDAGAQALAAVGAQAHRGTLEDPATLAAGAEHADAVIHLAFDHDFANFVANCEKDRRVVTALGEALKGSNRPLVVTSGTAIGAHSPGEMATEDAYNADYPMPRIATEQAAAAAADAGVDVRVVRLPQVHDPVKQGFVTPVIAAARAKRRSAYVGDGQNRWPAAHVDDVAQLYRLVVEKGEAGARYHAVDEEGVAAKAMAEVIGAGLGLPVVSLAPEEAFDHFGWLAMFAGADMPASSALTRQRLGWRPTGPGLLEDLRRMDYTAPV